MNQRVVRRSVSLLGLLGILFFSPLSVTATQADPDTHGGVNGDTVFVAAVEQTQQDANDPGASQVVSPGRDAAFTEYRWVSVCVSPSSPAEAAIETDCNAARACAEPRERLYRLWGRSAATESWVPLSTRCFGGAPPDAETPQVEITPALVLNEIRRIGLPTLQARTQPEDKTLVNFDTIFYTRTQPFTASVTLLGQAVDITAEPTSFTWHHGDGTTATTRTPGAPYPSREITHRYTDADTTVRPRLDVTYSARFRVNDGTWQDIDQTVTITGPESTLRVSEATPVLSGNYS
jgi:hypothetical protein